MTRSISLPAAALLLLAAEGTSHAGNGLNDFGFGPESTGMASADLAVSRDTAALNINPAGLTQIADSALDLNLEPFIYTTTGHRDAFGNDTKVDNPIGAVLNGGYATHLSPDLVGGLGFFAQGGTGYVYEGLHTAFGTRDDAVSIFGSFKLEPGLAWKVSDRLSVGAAIGIVWSSARQKLFYDTSVAPSAELPTGFSGFRVDSLSGWSGGAKYGLQYRPAPGWVIALAYTDEIPIRLKGGEARFNFEQQGLGRVRYRNASVEGLNIAGEIGGGVSWQATPKLLIATEINWLDWSHAISESVLRVSHPDSAQAPQEIVLAQRIDWRDQWVWAIGTEWQWTPATRLRAGFNYGRNPCPHDTMSPLLNLTGTTAFAVGFGHRFSQKWEFKSAALYQVTKRVTYTNPQSVFGNDARESWGGMIFFVAFSRRW